MRAGDLGLLAVRGLLGGGLVVVFALIGEVVKPKAFSGLFAAAPSVALASLAITMVAEGSHTAKMDAVGMVVGGVAMAACCVLAVEAIPRLRALAGSAVAWAGWLVVACGLYWTVFIGVH